MDPIHNTVYKDNNSTCPDEKQKLEALSNSLVESLPGFIFVFDDQFFLREVYMPESMKLFHSMKELVGMDARLIYSPEVSELLIHNIQGCLEDGQLRELEYPVDLKGLRFYYQARIVPYRDNMVLAFIQDIGDRVRRIEELVDIRKREESNLMKSTFLANMSHEIRTPLNAIVGFSEILATDEFAADKEEVIAIIRKNNELLLQLVNDILDISRIESGRIEINILQTELNELLKETKEIHRMKMKPEVELRLVQPQGKFYTFTDPNRVRQVLHNFLSNAIKHTEKGSITLQLEVEKDNSFLFSVADTGTGIPDDKLQVIFDRFEKLDSFTQGTGLGLAISKSLVENLGGEIMATSKVGEGSTFSFRLPYRKTMAEALAAPSSHPRKENVDEDSTGRKKILIIETNDLDFGSFKTLLSREYLLVRAVNNEEASLCYKEKTPDLIMVNVSEPEIDSLEIIREIRSKYVELPIIALTEYGNYADQELALKAGCNDIVLKPYTATRLKDAIVAYI